jgi:hypothetical protein
MFGDGSAVTWDSHASGSDSYVVPGKLRVRDVHRIEARAALRAWEVSAAAVEEPAVLIFGDWGQAKMTAALQAAEEMFGCDPNGDDSCASGS